MTPLEKLEVGNSEKAKGTPLTKRILLLDVLNQVITPSIHQMESSTKELQRELSKNCQLEVQDFNETAWDRAIVIKHYWEKAMEIYHYLEPLQIGPMKQNNFALLKNLYSYPETNRCGIDREVFKLNNSSPSQPLQFNNRKGLDAIEYLLYKSDFNHSCSRQTRALQGWDNLSPEKRHQLRCEFLKILSLELVKDVERLVGQWEGFRQSLNQIDENQLLNDLVFALFFIEKQSKDQVLGIPTGLSKANTRCYGQFCIENIEHKESLFTKKQLLSHIQAFKDVMSGQSVFDENTKAYGIFDFILLEKNPTSQNTVEQLKASVELITSSLKNWPNHYGIFNALAGVSSYDLCKASTTQERKVEVCAVYQDFRALTQLMKQDFVIALSTRLPTDSQGDGD